MKKDINIGDTFDLTGYELLGHAATDFGQVVLLSNNSSHYLVASVQVCAGERATVGTLRAAFETLDGKGTLTSAYAKALREMTRLALDGSPSLREEDDDKVGPNRLVMTATVVAIVNDVVAEDVVEQHVSELFVDDLSELQFGEVSVHVSYGDYLS